MKKALPVLLIILGAGLLLYPSVANYYNSLVQARVITGYNDAVRNMAQDDIDAMWNEAVMYNRGRRYGTDFAHLGTLLEDKEAMAKYNSTLDVTGTGVMGYIEIPKLAVRLPIYHGTDEGVLRVAAGHLEWTSLPVGGKGQHAVLTGHRGLPNAKLFTDLPELSLGDTFVLRILDRALTYRVDQIVTVLPEDIDELKPVAGKDYCTLVTCTPYGINTHRLLVRGTRVKNGEAAWSAIIDDDAIVVSIGTQAAIMTLIIMGTVLAIKRSKRLRKK